MVLQGVMGLRTWVSDLQLILQKSKISKDSRIFEPHLGDLVNKYRAIAIRQSYTKYLEIQPAWLQDLGLVDFTRINSGEDPSIRSTSLQLGKCTIPALVELPDDTGMQSLFYASRNSEWYKCDYNKLFGLTPGTDQARFDYFSRIGNALYMNNPQDKARPVVVLDNPIEGFVLLSENVKVLIIGQEYTVMSGTITSNSVTYNSGTTFTATATTFTGTGTVQFKNQKRSMTWDDAYPMSRTMGEFVCMKILTNEFAVEPKQIADIQNDSQDQLALLQPQPRAE